MNLFASFVLKALAVLGKDIVFHNSYSRRPDTEREWVSYMSEVCPPPGGSVLGQRQGGGLEREEGDKGGQTGITSESGAG